MCPEKERKFREREGLLHILEIKTGTEKHKRPTADPNCTVKCFSRSAAGQEMQKLSDLRPPPILLQTILYLFNNVLTNKTMEWSTLYQFVFDRLRAVRQDMVIQGVEASDSITLLELIVRFHAYAGFRVSPLSDALSLSLAYWVRNFVAVYRSIFKLPPLLACVAASHLPFLRRQTLQVMSVAYNGRNLSYPLSELQVLLLYASEQEAHNDCRHYNIEVKDCRVVFNKNTFNSGVSKCIFTGGEAMAALKETEDEAVTRFREYLRIPSVHPNVNYDECVSFLTRQASSLGLPIQVHQLVKNKPIVVITWEGTNPTLPTILLNSHMDVVPVYREKWTKDPFNAEKDEHGNIYGRGSQDMKCVGIQYLEAIRKLKKEGVKLRRTVHISFMPDEEIGGKDGMRKFVNTSDFFELNIGVALDESVASPMEELLLFYAERSSWNVEVHCSGTPGHGTLFHEDTSGEKLQIILDRFMTYRQQQKDILETKPHPIFSLAEVTSLNLTQMKVMSKEIFKRGLSCQSIMVTTCLSMDGGVQSTLVPPDLVLVFDVRVAIDQDHQELEELMQSWCLEAGPGVTLTFAQKDPNFGITELDHNNPWWAAFKGACNEMEVNLRPMICPGVTDARYIRQAS
uniref:N-acyl-aliphatic-L-amino acid amidohydrolase n=1 Tax=Timema poppense TaxID=170557 RepID=A0A7R9GT30_TIMPO|nr:unnamed protein product [Timema poppensis]